MRYFHGFFCLELFTIDSANCFLDVKINSLKGFTLFSVLTYVLLLIKLEDSLACDAIHESAIKDSFSLSLVLFQQGSAFVYALQSLIRK